MNEPTLSDKRKSIRWSPLFWILGINLVIQVGLWIWLEDDRTLQFFTVMAVVSATVLEITIWWLIFSRTTWGVCFFGLGIVGIVVGILSSIICFDGVRGEMIPRFRFVWQESAEERARDFHQSQDLSDEGSHGLKEDPDAWTGYRGNGAQGVISAASLPEKITGVRDLWRHPIGRGRSSFAIADGLAFTMEQIPDSGESLSCYDAETGKLLWTQIDESIDYDHPLGGAGPRSTPTIHRGLVYGLGATGKLKCIDPADHSIVWEVETIPEASEIPEYGVSASPLAFQDLIIVAASNSPERSLRAYDWKTGEHRWDQKTPAASYTTPQISRIADQDLLLFVHSQGINLHDPVTGNEISSFVWKNGPAINATQPLVWGNDLFLSTGYAKGSVLLTLDEKNELSAKWKEPKFRLKFNSGVVLGDHVYGLDEGLLKCLDLKTGKVIWSGKRFGYGQMLLADDRLLILDEDGNLVIAKASAEGYQQEFRSPVLEGQSWNVPAWYRNRLYIRNSEWAACLELIGE